MNPSEPLPRMRIYRGRVMHRVERDGTAGYKSMCRRRGALKGLTHPRARGRFEDWSAERHWYPDCTHCPTEDS